MALTSICLPIQKELKDVETFLNENVSSEIELVTTAAKYVLQNGGKRIRPALLILCAKMMGASDDRPVSLAAAIEMIHAASLLHDDVLDNASLRRGKPTVNVKWGNQISILVGDFLWCKASEITIARGSDKILLAITEAVKKTTEGEILEIVRSNDFNVSEQEYLTVIKLKTAMLFACSCEIGAILGGGTEHLKNLFKNYGFYLGMAFQLADDVLDYSASDERIGKKTGTDLCEGKLTLPIILTLQKCDAEEKSIIKEALVANNLDAGKFYQIKNILNKYNSLEFSLEEARKFAKKAKDELSSFKPSIEKDALIALANYSVDRNQ